MVGLILFLMFCVLAAVAGAVHLGAPPQRPRVRARRCSPSRHHWLGTTSLGQDIWAQLVYGTRQSLVIALVAGLFATVLSVLVGVSAPTSAASPTRCCR